MSNENEKKTENTKEETTPNKIEKKEESQDSKKSWDHPGDSCCGGCS